jgi:hypothetical protein
VNKNLLVEIFVPIVGGEGLVATGYPVAPGRILTARHVLYPEDREKDKPIEVRWYHLSGPARAWRSVPAAVWEDQTLDTALLACEFPEGIHGWGSLSGEKPRDHRPWCSEGFARAGKREDGSRKPVPLKGECCSMADTAQEFVVDVDAATTLPNGWKGASGSPVFVADGIIGVIKTCPANFDGRRLEATPVWRILLDPVFRSCVGLDERADRLEEIRADLAKSLRSCPRVMEFLRRELDVAVQTSNADLWAEDLAQALTEKAIEELLPKLNRAHHKLWEEPRETVVREGPALAKVAGLTMPVLFNWAVIQYAQRQVSGGQIALVSLPVATKTVAEIVMAGTDKRPAEFRAPAAEREFPVGTLCLPAPPEGGIDPDNMHFRKALLTQLCEKFLSKDDRDRYRDNEGQLSRLVCVQLEHDLAQYGRRFYFFFDFPSDESTRRIWKVAIDELKRLYPPIAFISLETDDDMVREERSLFSSLRDMLWRAAQAGNSS